MFLCVDCRNAHSHKMLFSPSTEFDVSSELKASCGTMSLDSLVFSKIIFMYHLMYKQTKSVNQVNLHLKEVTDGIIYDHSLP